jgi:hypothetical protein
MTWITRNTSLQNAGTWTTAYPPRLEGRRSVIHASTTRSRHPSMREMTGSTTDAREPRKCPSSPGGTSIRRCLKLCLVLVAYSHPLPRSSRACSCPTRKTYLRPRDPDPSRIRWTPRPLSRPEHFTSQKHECRLCFASMAKAHAKSAGPPLLGGTLGGAPVPPEECLLVH